MNPANRVAVSLGLESTAATLEELSRLEPWIGLAEVRLDLMAEFDLERLVSGAPCPLVVTCRAPREGGSFGGAESERLEILSEASALGAAYVDVEWDCVAAFRKKGSRTRVIASRHFYDSMPPDLWDLYLDLRRGADIVKLVGYAARLTDALPVVDLIVRARSPLIGIAMGAAGLITRLVAPCFESCVLTYAAADAAAGTAPGQISVRDMVEHFGVDRVGFDTPIVVHLFSDPGQRPEAMRLCRGDGSRLGVPAQVEREHMAAARETLEALSPRIRVNALG